MWGKRPRNVRARLAPLFIPERQTLSSGTLIHSWSSNDQLSAPGQNSVSTVGQNSIGANIRDPDAEMVHLHTAIRPTNPKTMPLDRQQ